MNRDPLTGRFIASSDDEEEMDPNHPDAPQNQIDSDAAIASGIQTFESFRAALASGVTEFELDCEVCSHSLEQLDELI